MSKVFTATQARQKFFELLKRVEKGEDAIILKKDQQIRFRITLEKPEKKKDYKKILKKMGEIGLIALPIKKMKKIIAKSHKIKL